MRTLIVGSRLAAGLVLGMLLFGTATAAAEGPDAKALFVAGQEAYNQGDYETAEAKWAAAYAKDPRPLLQYNLGNVYERLSRLGDALAAYEKYLATAPDDDDVRRAEVSAKVERIRSRLKETGIVVSGAPDGSEILIDGNTWGLTPRPDPIPVQPGSHNVTLKNAHYEDFTAVVSVGAGKKLEVTATMAPKPDETVATAASDEGADKPFPIVPVALMAGGGAVFVGGLVVGILASGKASDSKTGDDGDADSARTLALVADITMGVGIAAAGVGLVLLLLDGGDAETPPTGEGTGVAVAPVVTPTFAGATATLRF
ncbi:MAG: PEGA domain-containing protein [Polyangiales bacterium]|nr:tetratricopeptide repeat protein [Myxococcales bacterium]